MKIGVIGAGRIGGIAARLLASAGHEVVLPFSRDEGRLERISTEIGERARIGTVPQAASFGDMVLLSVPWTVVPAVIDEVGALEGRVLIDAANQFGPGGLQAIPDGLTAAQFNQQRIPGCRLVKAFNALTAGFQAAEAGRPAGQRVVLFQCGDDPEAKTIVASLIDDASFAVFDVGTLANAAPMEAPRRAGALYGEEYRPVEAAAAIAALPSGRPLPPTPDYTTGWF